MAYTDRFPIVNNFLETRLSADCDEGATTLFLESAEALPNILIGRDYVPLVLRDAGTEREIVYIDAVDKEAGTVTVRRGQENTTPATWAAGSYVYCTVTADSFQRMRVNGFAPLVAGDGRPRITRISTTTVKIAGDFTEQLEVGMAVRVLSGDTVVEPTDVELGAIHIASVSFSVGETSVSFQNVSLPTKVDGLDLGLSVAAAPMYHPDAVVADEDTLTQTQNVLSVSEKFKTELNARNAEQDEAIRTAQNSANAAQSSANAAQSSADAAQSSADEAISEVSELDAALRALVAQEVAKCLKLSGGTMAGNINFSQDGDAVLWKTKSTARFILRGGGSEFADGASLYLHGKNNTTDPGAALLYAHDGAENAWVKLTPAGKMFVKSNEVLTFAGGSVGKLVGTGELVFTRNVDNNRLWISGGTDMTSGALILYGKEHAEYANEARLKAGNTQLRVLPAGGAMLGGAKVLTEASGTASVSAALAVSSVVVGDTTGKTFTLPNVGTWAYTYHRYTYGDNAGGSGVAAGGTTVTAAETHITYFAIRIA